MGYQALYSYWMQQADKRLEAHLEKADYNEQELETIIVPLHLPYLYDQAGYERTDGEIMLNGITYKYVQRRVWHDSLYLQCLPHHEAMRLATARSDSFQLVNGLPQNSNGFSKVGITLSKQFTPRQAFSQFAIISIFLIDAKGFFIFHSDIPYGNFATGPEQPPKVLV